MVSTWWLVPGHAKHYIVLELGKNQCRNVREEIFGGGGGK